MLYTLPYSTIGGNVFREIATDKGFTCNIYCPYYNLLVLVLSVTKIMYPFVLCTFIKTILTCKPSKTLIYHPSIDSSFLKSFEPFRTTHPMEFVSQTEL